MTLLPSSNAPSKHNLLWLCAASAAMAFGLNVTSVALPFILKHLGGTDGDVGLCIALNTGIYALFCLGTAFLLDHLVPARITRFGAAGMGLAVLAMGAVVLWHSRRAESFSPIPWMLWFYAFHGACTAFYWPYLMGWVSIGYEGKQLSRRLGFYNISWSLAGCLGPFLGGVLVQFSPLLPLAITVLTTAFSAFCVLKAGPAPSVQKTPPTAESDIITIHPALRQFRWIALIGLFLGHVILSLVRSQLGLYMKFDLGFLEKSYGLVITFQALTVFLANAVVGWTHFWHFNRILYALFIAALLVSVGIITQTTHLSGFMISCSLLGMCVGFLYSSHMYYGVSGGQRRSARMAIHEIALAAGYFTGSLGGGYLSDHFNRVWPYWFGSAVVLLGAAVQMGLWFKLRRKPGSPPAV